MNMIMLQIDGAFRNDSELLHDNKWSPHTRNVYMVFFYLHSLCRFWRMEEGHK